MLGSVVIDLQLEMHLAILPATKFETAFTVLVLWTTGMTACCWGLSSGIPCVARVVSFDLSSFLMGPVLGERSLVVAVVAIARSMRASGVPYGFER